MYSLIFIVHYNTFNTKHNSDKEKNESVKKKMLLKVIYSVVFNLGVAESIFLAFFRDFHC